MCCYAKDLSSFPGSPPLRHQADDPGRTLVRLCRLPKCGRVRQLLRNSGTIPPQVQPGGLTAAGLTPRWWKGVTLSRMAALKPTCRWFPMYASP